MLLSLALSLIFAVAGDAPSASPIDQAIAPAAPTKISAALIGRTWGDAIRQYRKEVNQALRESGNPRDWLLESYAMLDHHGPGETTTASPSDYRASGALLRKAAEAAPNDPLVQWAWARARPERSGCDDQRPCPDRSMALARLEPNNAAAWEPIVGAALRTSDIQKADRALANMATSMGYNDRIEGAALAFRDIYRRFPAPDAPLLAQREHPVLPFPTSAESLQDSFARSAAEEITQGISDESFFPPRDICSRVRHPSAPATRFRDCARIGRLMIDHGNLNGRLYLRESGRDTDADRRAARVLDWQYWEDDDFSGAHEPLPFARRIHDWFADLEETHDAAEAFRRSLSRRGIPLTPPVNWQPPGGVFGRW